jgi:putative transposase
MPAAFKYLGVRKSHQSFNEIYFWTSVITDWKHLLNNDVLKMIIIQSFQWLVQHELVYIYGYVIMPNHIHVESFEKYTGHMF